MAGATITINDSELLISLGQLQASVADKTSILRIVGAYMLKSVLRTYTAEGYPDGSWPALAESTRKKKGYTAGHKLLVMRGILKNSLGYQVSGDSVSIGSQGVPYARVQFMGSADRSGGSIGAQAKIPGRAARVSAYDALRVKKFRQYGTDVRKGRTVHVRAQGPDNATRFKVGAHERHQNIPARNPLVFRQEDPANIVSAIDVYFGRLRAVHS